MQLDDKIALKKLREAIDKALAPVADQLGLTKLRAGNIRYEPSGLSAKITLDAETVGSGGETKEQAAWAQYAQMYGLKPEWLHMSFRRAKGETVEILGLVPSRSKFPVLVTNTATNKQFLLTIEEVQRKFGEPQPQIGGLELVPPPRRGASDVDSD